jgi:hypothetical protein
VVVVLVVYPHDHSRMPHWFYQSSLTTTFLLDRLSSRLPILASSTFASKWWLLYMPEQMYSAYDCRKDMMINHNESDLHRLGNKSGSPNNEFVPYWANRTVGTIFKLDLYFLVKYLHMWFQPYRYISTRVRKLKISNFFLHSTGKTLSKIIKPWPSSCLAYLFLWCIYMSYLSWMCTTEI